MRCARAKASGIGSVSALFERLKIREIASCSALDGHEKEESKMTNIHPLTSGNAPNVAEAIDEEIQHRCWCLVNKRLALRLARVLLPHSPTPGDLLLAKMLLGELTDRIDCKVSRIQL
jgi:hypothetical protein